MQQLVIIVAMNKDRTIGHEGKMPWHLPEDLKRFKNITMGSTIVMGRKTYESIGKALPGRTNVVLTRDKTYRLDDALVCRHKGDIFKMPGKIFIIGGADIYAQFIDYVDEMHITYVYGSHPGDTFFPEFDESEWRIDNRLQEETHEYVKIRRI